MKHEVQQILLVFKNELSSLVSFMPEGPLLKHVHRKNISLEITFGKGVETLGLTTVLTDRSRFTQIITNVSLSFDIS